MLIGLGHKMRVGKTTIANYLIREHGFKEVCFATALKECCRAVFGFTDEQLYGSLKSVDDPYWGIPPGRVLQTVGTDLFRNHFREDVWIKALMKAIATNPQANWVVHDVRFKNEAKALLSRGGFVFKVVRQRAYDPSRDHNHVSEVDLDDFIEWSGIIVNDGTFNELYDQVDGIIKALK